MGDINMKSLTLLILTLAALAALAGCGTYSTTTTAPEPQAPTGPSAAERDSAAFILRHIDHLDAVMFTLGDSCTCLGNGQWTKAELLAGNAAANFETELNEWSDEPSAGGAMLYAESLYEALFQDVADAASGIGSVLEGGSADEALGAIDAYGDDRSALMDELDSAGGYQ